jgi:hypothetical protein
MRIAALLALLTPVAAATIGCVGAPAVAAPQPNNAGQPASTATHPAPFASGGTRPLNELDTRLLHLVGDNESGVSQLGLAAFAAVDQPVPPANDRPSAIPAAAPLPPAKSIPPPSTWVRETVATSVPNVNEDSGTNVGIVIAFAFCLVEIAGIGLLRLHRSARVAPSAH